MMSVFFVFFDQDHKVSQSPKGGTNLWSRFGLPLATKCSQLILNPDRKAPRICQLKVAIYQLHHTLWLMMIDECFLYQKLERLIMSAGLYSTNSPIYFLNQQIHQITNTNCNSVIK